MPFTTAPQLVQIMTAANGAAPVCLLDILTSDGQAFYWSQLGLLAPPKLLAAGDVSAQKHYEPRLLNVAAFQSSRSMQVSYGSLDVENIAGDTLARDTATAFVNHTFENALFVLREWYPEGECVGYEMHGRLTVDGVPETDATLACTQLFNASGYETPQYTFSETCEWRYGSVQCGADGTNPCQNSFTTCRVPERFQGILNNYTQDLSPSIAATAQRLVNRTRQF